MVTAVGQIPTTISATVATPKQSGASLMPPPGGNLPNGTYALQTSFVAPVTGTYTLTVTADDAALVLLDGRLLGYTSLFGGAQPPTNISNLQAGTHTLLVFVVNNNLGSPQFAPYGSGVANATLLTLNLKAPNGVFVVTTASATGWVLYPYTSVSQSASYAALPGGPLPASVVLPAPPGTAPKAASGRWAPWEIAAVGGGALAVAVGAVALVRHGAGRRR